MTSLCKLQTYSRHQVRVCHSVVPTDHIPHYPSRTFFHSAVHSSVALFNSPPAFPPCPHSLTLESPDTLDGGFPSGPRPSGSPHESNDSLASHSPKSLACTTEAMAPRCSGGSRCLTQMFSVGALLFSLQTRLISRAAPSLRRLVFLPNLLSCEVVSFI